jgi:hypothetical protein
MFVVRGVDGRGKDTEMAFFQGSLKDRTVHSQTPHGRVLHTQDAPTTYSHRPEYDEACTPISGNCTSTVIDP